MRMSAAWNGVDAAGELCAMVADEESEPVGVLGEVHRRVAGHLGGPLCHGMRGGSQDVDAPGGVFDHRQNVRGGAIEQVQGEESVVRIASAWERRKSLQRGPDLATCSSAISGIGRMPLVLLGLHLLGGRRGGSEWWCCGLRASGVGEAVLDKP